jgi:hypothetical protein
MLWARLMDQSVWFMLSLSYSFSFENVFIGQELVVIKCQDIHNVLLPS